jgi:hypothetical protein
MLFNLSLFPVYMKTLDVPYIDGCAELPIGSDR